MGLLWLIGITDITLENEIFQFSILSGLVEHAPCKAETSVDTYVGRANLFYQFFSLLGGHNDTSTLEQLLILGSDVLSAV